MYSCLCAFVMWFLQLYIYLFKLSAFNAFLQQQPSIRLVHSRGIFFVRLIHMAIFIFKLLFLSWVLSQKINSEYYAAIKQHYFFLTQVDFCEHFHCKWRHQPMTLCWTDNSVTTTMVDLKGILWNKFNMARLSFFRLDKIQRNSQR